MFGFFKGIQRVSVGNHDREGDALVEFYLSIEKAYSLGFGKAEALEELWPSFSGQCRYEC